VCINPARPRKIRPPQPNYQPGLQQKARSQHSGPARPRARPCAVRVAPLIWRPLMPMLPVCLARCYFTWKFTNSCVAFFAVLHESSKCLCGILAIIREMCMWLHGYFTSSAIVGLHHSRSPPPSSSATVVIRCLPSAPLQSSSATSPTAVCCPWILM